MPDWRWISGLLDFCTVYYTTQLVRCAAFSFLLAGFVMLLRKMLFSRRIFLKGMLWSLFLVIPFLGRLKLFYENEAVLRATWRVTVAMASWLWVDRIYMAGILVAGICIFGKRWRLRRSVTRACLKIHSYHLYAPLCVRFAPNSGYIARYAPFIWHKSPTNCDAHLAESNFQTRSRMEKVLFEDVRIYVTEMNITPFAVGLVKPKIILPRVMLENYSGDELKTVIRHEQTHIRLGHLWFGFGWDILRCLFWVNPFLTVIQKSFQTDMEDICDQVCIQSSGRTAHEYGMVLLKSLKLLRSGMGNVPSATTYAGEKGYADIKRRMEKIADFRPYRKRLCIGMAAGTVLVVGGLLLAVHTHSYGRYNESQDILVGSCDGKNTIISSDTEELSRMISYDDYYVYVDRAAFEDFLHENNAEGDICIAFGGFYKLPGLGGAGEICFYERASEDEIVRIPYESIRNHWYYRLYKML